MIVTRIDPVAKTKYKIYIDEQFAFMLYKSELSRYELAVGELIEENIYEEIKRDVVLKRAKLRTMNLLSVMDRTESQLRTKLKQNNYTEEIIEKALDYVKAYGYLNDYRYAENYVMSNHSSKSRKEIFVNLCNKGISREYVEQALESEYGDGGDVEAIRAIVKKKRYDADTATEAETKKIYGYLARKGFRYEDIRQVIQVSGLDA